MSKSTVKPISQPGDWWEIFQAQASLEGLPLAEWIGEACKQRCLDACRTTDKAQEVARSFSPRVRRGRVAYKGPPAGIEEPTELPPPPPAARSPEQ